MPNTNTQQDYYKAIKILQKIRNDNQLIVKYVTVTPAGEKLTDIIAKCIDKLQKLENALKNNSSDKLPSLSNFNLNAITDFSRDWDAKEAEGKKQKQYDHLLSEKKNAIHMVSNCNKNTGMGRVYGHSIMGISFEKPYCQSKQYVQNFIDQLEEKLRETFDEDDVDIELLQEYAAGYIYSVIIHAPLEAAAVKIIDEFCKPYQKQVVQNQDIPLSRTNEIDRVAPEVNFTL